MKTTGWGEEAADNSFLAEAFAQVIHGFLFDCAERGVEELPMILEVGPGTGHFGYQLITELAARCQRSGLGAGPLAAQGLLDVARIDSINENEPIALRHSRVELKAGSLAGPLVVVANHALSESRQDLFYVEGGELYECIEDEYELRFISGDYYENIYWNRILTDYRECLADAVISFPSAALRWMERMAALSGESLFLCTDSGEILKDSHTEHSFVNETHAGNYDAMAKYTTLRGGVAYGPLRPTSHQVVAGFLWSDAAEKYPETLSAFDAALTEFARKTERPITRTTARPDP